MVVPIYCNAAFGYGRDLTQFLDDFFFECQGNTTVQNLLISISWKDITRNGVLYSRELLLIRGSIPLTVNKYYILKSAYQIAIRKNLKVEGDGVGLSEYFNSFKKGSKNFELSSMALLMNI
jgi:hypothetical protein